MENHLFKTSFLCLFLVLCLFLIVPSALGVESRGGSEDFALDRSRHSSVNLIQDVFPGRLSNQTNVLKKDSAMTTFILDAPKAGHSYGLFLKDSNGYVLPVDWIRSVVFYDEDMKLLASSEDAAGIDCPGGLSAACAHITVDNHLVDTWDQLSGDSFMICDLTSDGVPTVFHPAMLPEVLTPEFFGTPNDADNLQACFDEGGDIRLDGVYQTGSTVLRIERQSSVVAGPDSGIYTDGYNEAYYLPIIEVSAEDVRLEGLRLFSSADYRPYIDVRGGIVNELGRASNRIGIYVHASRCHIYNLYGEYLGLIRLENADDCVFDGLHGQYIENGIYTPGTRNTTVTNADFKVSRDIRSTYYHYFYFTNPVNCSFSHIYADAVGDADFCNSDIFHFNFSSSWKRLGGPVTVTDATAADGAFYRFAQCNNQVQARFVNCRGQLRDQICLLSNEARARFEDCDFTVTRGTKKVYGFRCSSAFNRILLKNCRITDLSEGYLFSDGIIAENCVFKLKAMNINAHDTVGGVEFWNCKFHADRLICIAPDKEGFRAEYHNCSFVFATSPEYLIQKGSAASILVSGGSVENCEALFKDRLNEKSHVDTSLK